MPTEVKNADTVRDAMGQAASNVLETMFFTMPEGDAAPELIAPQETLCATVHFSGEWAGDFAVEAPLLAAREIAANFSGAIDPSEVSEAQVSEVLSELANMVCGSTLSILDRDCLFDLGAPQVSTHVQAAAVPATVRALDLGNGTAIVFSLASDAVAS